MLAFGLICLCVVGQVLGACEDDLKQDKGFQQCQQNLAQFGLDMAAAMQGEGADQNTATKLMCSPQGKDTFTCILKYSSECPAIAKTLNMPAGANLPMIQQLGGVEAMCKAMGGGGGGGDGGMGGNGGAPQPEPTPCAAAMECTKNQGPDVDEPPAGSTPFSNIQFQLEQMCGQIKTNLMCLENAKKSCPKEAEGMANSIKQAMAAERQSKAGQPNTVPTYDMALMFVKQECGSVPKDFATSKCVKENIESEEFVDCFANITQSQDPKSCTAYHAGEKCVMSTVGEKCGKDHGLIIVKGAKQFIANIPTTCEPMTQISGTTTIQASVATLIMLVLTVFKMI